MNELPNILSLSKQALENGLVGNGLPKFRAKQIWDWVHCKGAINPEDMRNISKIDQEKMAGILDFSLPEIVTEQKSSDGTVKWLLRMVDGHEIETVFIPEETRGTLCVSSQVGCTLNCRFCHTGTQGLARNLEIHEIVAQVWLAKTQLNEWAHDKNSKRIITNIVFMGMGEPLFNWENVRDACKILMDKNGLGFGGRKITISTSGMVENIQAIGEELATNLAISLHAADDETRTKIMPINKKWPLAELMKAVRDFPLREHRRITWEYVMLKGINDSEKHAKDLIKLVKNIPSFVNIIPFNEWPGSPFECSDAETISIFAKIIEKAGVAVNIRRSRGEDILAACGQLRGETSKFNTISTAFPSVVEAYGSEIQKNKVKIEEVV